MKEQAKKTNVLLAAHLKELRQDEGLTMRQLATKLQTPHSFVGKLEKQGRRLDVGEFIHYNLSMAKDPIAVLKDIIAKI